MSRYADRVRFLDTHSIWGVLPKKARREMARLYGSRSKKKTIAERDEELNKLLCRYGRPDLQIVKLYNRDVVVRARQNTKGTN